MRIPRRYLTISQKYPRSQLLLMIRSSGKGEVEAQAKTIVENLRYGDTDAAGAAEEFVTTAQKILSEAAK